MTAITEFSVKSYVYVDMPRNFWLWLKIFFQNFLPTYCDLLSRVACD